MMTLPVILHTISKELKGNGAKAVVVGGSVRDHFLKLPIKDYDVEVYGLESLEDLEKILSEFGSVNLVGKSFGVLKFVYEKEEYDFSFPRLESKVGKGHRGFEVTVDGKLDFKTAAKRRDFTVNAMGYDIEEKCFLDPFNAQEDMNNKILRHINDDSFVEDPLRVYRAVQFAARFGYALAEETMVLCQNMVERGMLEELPKERVYAEFKKLLLKSEKPSVGFLLMRKLGILKYFPELVAIIDVPQSPKWHPEGDVWIHTMLSLDSMSRELGIRKGKLDIKAKQKLKLLFAILCHDLGKASTTTVDENGDIRSIGHEQAGIALTRTFMYRLTDEHDFIESFLPLVEHHLKPSWFYAQGAKDPAIRRLATKVNIEELVCVAKADFLGRTTKEAKKGAYEAGEWLLEKAEALHVKEKAPDSFLQGKDLISLGLQPSILFGKILEDVYEKQIEGVIVSKEEAVSYVQKNHIR
jgi:tRNA nucleotidyltransferase (CCA-adding enzyme)